MTNEEWSDYFKLGYYLPINVDYIRLCECNHNEVGSIILSKDIKYKALFNDNIIKVLSNINITPDDYKIFLTNSYSTGKVDDIRHSYVVVFKDIENTLLFKLKMDDVVLTL